MPKSKNEKKKGVAAAPPAPKVYTIVDGKTYEVVDGVVESLKVITHEKSLRVAEYAFEFAFLNNRRRVTAVHKANIMKKGDGMFLKACKEVAARYPTVEYTEMIGELVGCVFFGLFVCSFVCR